MTLEERLSAAEAELAAIRKEMTPEPEDRFVPKNDDQYYFVDSTGEVRWAYWNDSGDGNFRLAIGNFGRTKADARRYKAKLCLIAPTGPCPKVGSRIYYWNLSRNDLGLAEAGSITAKGAVSMWGLGECCLEGFEQELEAKWRRYGWSVTGEPEPEGWEG